VFDELTEPNTILLLSDNLNLKVKVLHP